MLTFLFAVAQAVKIPIFLDLFCMDIVLRVWLSVHMKVCCKCEYVYVLTFIPQCCSNSYLLCTVGLFRTKPPSLVVGHDQA